MKPPQITVSISGPTKAGKTSLALELYDLCNKYGVECHLFDPDGDETVLYQRLRPLGDVLKDFASRKVVINIETKTITP